MQLGQRIIHVYDCTGNLPAAAHRARPLRRKGRNAGQRSVSGRRRRCTSGARGAPVAGPPRVQGSKLRAPTTHVRHPSALRRRRRDRYSPPPGRVEVRVMRRRSNTAASHLGVSECPFRVRRQGRPAPRPTGWPERASRPRASRPRAPVRTGQGGRAHERRARRDALRADDRVRRTHPGRHAALRAEAAVGSERRLAHPLLRAQHIGG